MSQRAKRPNRSDDGSGFSAKRRKCRPTIDEEDITNNGMATATATMPSTAAAAVAASATTSSSSGGSISSTVTLSQTASVLAAAVSANQQQTTGSWQLRPINDLKISSIYNRSATEAPAELFRKDLISAMKLPDSEPLASDEYWVITDQWKQEWERGVQVPVNPDSLPEPSVTVTQCAGITKTAQNEFKLPKNKYIRITKDDQFLPEEHILSATPSKAEAACSYDLDDADMAWLHLFNGERALSGLCPVTEDQLERVIEQLEVHCWDRIQTIMKNEEGLGIEYDENVICDVCRSPDSEEGNEMVFCDSCNICVHQACYGITTIPSGQWLCCTCALGQRPDCVLCPNKGGAMKCTRSGQKWAHVSCALWIPEVSIGCVERMEPITKISSIPQSRWALICVLCRERVGACIQCSVKTCKTAYHVTCAFKHGLEMRAIIEDENADDGVKLRSYCQKHSVSSKKEKSICSGSEDDDNKRKKRKDMTSEEKNQARAARLQEIEAEFDKHVSVKDVMQVEVDNEGLHFIYNYWKLKRRAGYNKPLLPPKSEDVDMLSHKQEQADLEKMKMFVQLRQDLERVRNLCYMVSRREKLSRSFFRMREQTFHKQASVLQTSGHSMNALDIAAVIEANHGPSIYDQLYSHSRIDHSHDFDTILARIAGIKSPPADSGDEKNLNGIMKDRKCNLSNPYKRLYLNGSSKRRSGSLYGSSMSSATNSDNERKPIYRSSTENEKLTSSSSPSARKKVQRGRKSTEKATERRRNRLSSIKVESSSEEDIKPDKKEWTHWPRNRTLRQMEREMASGTDSDELMPIRLSKPTADAHKLTSSAIYSDSDDSSESSLKNEDKSSNAASDSQQNRLRTKASVKEFSLHSKPSKKRLDDVEKEDDEKTTTTTTQSNNKSKKKDYVPSELIVPQRQAAKKASENLKTTTSRNKETISNNNVSLTNSTAPSEHEQKVTSGGNDDKPKVKLKSKSNKDRRGVEGKETKGGDIFDIDKELDKEESQEIIAYVPQRQAAKKAAEHIKSGLGKSTVPEINDTDSSKTKKEVESSSATSMTTSKGTRVNRKESTSTIVEHHHEKANANANRITENKRKSSTNSTTSSSSSTSSTSSTSSSSESEEESPPRPTTAATKKVPLVESLFSTPAIESKRNSTKDWPFLDKGAKSANTVPASSSSDSSDSFQQQQQQQQQKKSVPNRIKTETSKPAGKTPVRTKTKESTKLENNNNNSGGGGGGGGKKFRKVATKKLKTSELRSESEVEQPSIVTREESSTRQLSHPSNKSSSTGTGTTTSSAGNQARVNKRQSSGDRGRDVDVGPGDLFNRQCSNMEPGKEQSSSTSANRKRKSIEVEREDVNPVNEQQSRSSKSSAIEKENIKSRQLPSPVRKTDKKLTTDRSPEKSSPSRAYNLEKEIMERKAGRDFNSRNKTMAKSTLDKLFEKRDKKLDDTTKLIQEDKQTVSKSPNKNKILFNDESKLNSLSDEIEKKKSPRYKKPEVYVDPKLRDGSTSKTTNKEPISKKSDEPTESSFVLNNIIESKLTETVTINRSIFSPQHPKELKDNSELFNFDNDMLNADESANDDGFTVQHNNNNNDLDESIRAPLTFQYNNDFLFKEDSKEDSARETLNLVEKLRMGMKKSTGGTTEDAAVELETSKQQTELELDVPLLPEKNEIVPVELVEQESSAPVPVEVQGQNQNYNEPVETNVNYNNYAQNEMQLELNKSMVPVQEHSCGSKQTDERWVPPGETSFSIAEKLYQQQEHEFLQQQLPLPPTELHDQLNVPMIENKTPPSAMLQERLMQHTPFLDPASMDCIPSPYADMHHQAKWADSEVLPLRRSSSSSAASSTSSCDHRTDVDMNQTKRDEIMLPNHHGLLPDLPFGILPQGMAPFPDALPFHTYSEASQFVTGPVSLFPPPNININNQLPFPSPGAAMFPPSYGAPFPAPHSVIPPIPKPAEDTLHFPTACTAAFTSSSHNMALTAAMVSLPPPPTPKPSVEDEQQVPPEETTTITNHASPPTKSGIPAGKKSPSKPTRTSARFVSQQSKLSPSKSPGKSPRQETTKSSSNRSRSKVTPRGSYSQTRGRGRGRGRGRSNHLQHSDLDYLGTNTIHNKLVGTVYDLDFDDDIASDNMENLRAMRERRRSTDVHERAAAAGGDRKTENSYFTRDSSQSPQQQSKIRQSYSTDLRELRPPTPISSLQNFNKSPLPVEEEPRTYPDIAQPVLPGPVDMRTYNTTFDPQPNTEAYSNQLLGAFATEQAEHHHHLPDIDEEEEKSLLAALNKIPEQTEPIDSDTVKVSLSDSRNQLKVKIKGPFLDANYTSTVVAPLPPQSNPEHIDNTSTASTNNNIITTSVTVSSGTSNLRRMRKKELLRQYWTQDMNMDDPTSGTVLGTTAPITIPPVNRTIITIPKAIASMTSIPTREDYKAVVDANMEKKRRKEKQSGGSGGLARELRHLDMPLDLDDNIPERRRSIGSTGSNASYEGNYKRKGRPPKPVSSIVNTASLSTATTTTTTTTITTTPKLKIKIGGFTDSNTITTLDDKKYKGRPPKKRLTTIPLPSVEDLKRESMKYRRMVMADFDEAKKKRNKGERSGRRKKRKSKHEVQIITNDSAKLIIRFGKKRLGEDVEMGGGGGEKAVEPPGPRTEQATDGRTVAPPSSGADGPGPPPAAAPVVATSATSALRKVRSVKLTPIRLKIARCHEDGGYVMKHSEQSSSSSISSVPDLTKLKTTTTVTPLRKSPEPTSTQQQLATTAPPLPPPVLAASSPPCAPLPLNKDCEVR